MNASARALAFMLLVDVAALPPAQAQNCSLRNPDRQIFNIFPDATSYRSVVRPIDTAVKEAVESRLGSELRLRDIGKHTLYIVLDGVRPIGFVHARSEIGERGAVELVWAYDLDLRVKDFRVQRCRERNQEAIKGEAFRRKLLGARYEGIRRFLEDGNQSVNVERLGVAPNARVIAHVAILGGATTRLVTEHAFGQAVLGARLFGNVYRFFPDTGQVTKALPSVDGGTLAAVEKILNAPATCIGRHDAVALRSMDSSGNTLGYLCQMNLVVAESPAEIWLAVGPQGRVRGITVLGVERSVADEAESLVGRPRTALRLASAEDAAPLEACLLELMAVTETLDASGGTSARLANSP